MPKTLIYSLVLLALLAAACSPLGTPSPTTAPTATQPAATAPSGAGESTAAVEAPVSDCTVVSILPTPGPTEVSLFPPASETDWTLGEQTAAVTFLEYSDFQ